MCTTRARHHLAHQTGKVAPVVVIAHACEFQAKAQATDGLDACVDRAIVLARPTPATVLAQPVRGHQVQTRLAVVVALEVAKVRVDRHATFAHHLRGEGGITVGGNVPVIRLHHLDAVDRVHTHQRWQQTRLPPAREAEADAGQPQYRHVLEAQLHIARSNRVFVFVDHHLAGLEQPVRQPACTGHRPAGAVTGLAHQHPALADKVHPVGRAVAAVFVQLELGLFKFANEAVHLQLQFRPLQQRAIAVDTHLALRCHFVLHLVVIDAFSAD